MTHTLHRLNDWPERLETLLRARADWPFIWGVNDCCTFTADAVQALTGVDVMRDIRGLYQTALQAHHLTTELGGLQAAVTTLLGEPVSPAFCTVGDVLLVRNAAREMLAVCNGGTALAPGPRGMLVLSDLDVLAAWRVA